MRLQVYVTDLIDPIEQPWFGEVNQIGLLEIAANGYRYRDEKGILHFIEPSKITRVTLEIAE